MLSWVKVPAALILICIFAFAAAVCGAASEVPATVSRPAAATELATAVTRNQAARV